MFGVACLSFVPSESQFVCVCGSQVAYNLRKVTLCRGKQLAVRRLVALLCLCVFLGACLAAPIHKHDSGQEGTCLLCHATERADIVPIAKDVGKPVPAAANLDTASLKPALVLEVPHWARTPRAPPSILL
jgi:hypothetical protein